MAPDALGCRDPRVVATWDSYTTLAPFRVTPIKFVGWQEAGTRKITGLRAHD